MYYGEEFVEELRSRVNILDIIGNYVQLKKKGNSYFGLCPFHSEKTGSFSVSAEKQMFYCFGCGKGGSVFTFLMEYENYTYPEAIEHLASQAGMELPKQELSEEQRQMADYRAVLREMNRDAANYFYKMLRHEHGKKGYAYFQSREITDETIKKFALGYSDIYRDDLYQYLHKKGYTDSQLRDSGLVEINEKGSYDKFWNRVMFPIVDMNGKVIGFGGRVMGDGEPKYLNSRETVLFEKKKNLYGLYFARKSKREGFLLCEGYMDVISLHQAGFDNAVASLGTAFTEEQARLIKRYKSSVYLAYDSDNAGKKAALRAIEICRKEDILVRVINMEPYKDPDEFIKNLGASEYEDRIRNAISGIMYEIKVIADNYNLNDPLSLTEFQKEAAKRLSFIEEKLERENYISSVARTYNMNEEGLRLLVNRYGEQRLRNNQYEEVVQKDKAAHRKLDQDVKDGASLQEKILLTWIVNYPDLLEQLKDWLTVDDFTAGYTRRVAKVMLKQYEDTGTIQPDKIIDYFTDVSEHSAVSMVLNQEVRLEEDVSSDGKLNYVNASKAVTETFIRVKEESINRQMKELTECADASVDKNKVFLNLLDMQQKLKNLYITIDNGVT